MKHNEINTSTWSAKSMITDSAGQWGEQKYKYMMTGKQSYK